MYLQCQAVVKNLSHLVLFCFFFPALKDTSLYKCLSASKFAFAITSNPVLFTALWRSVQMQSCFMLPVRLESLALWALGSLVWKCCSGGQQEHSEGKSWPGYCEHLWAAVLLLAHTAHLLLLGFWTYCRCFEYEPENTSFANMRHIEGELLLNLILKAISWDSKQAHTFKYLFILSVFEECLFCPFINYERICFPVLIPTCIQYIPKEREMCKSIYNSNWKHSYYR